MSRLVIPKLAFLLHIPDMYFHYQPILKHLPPGSFDIMLPDEPHPSLLQLLDQHEYPFAYISELMESRTMYKYMVSDHLFLQDYKLMQNLGVRHIRIISELGFDRLQLGNDNRCYDIILSFGRYQINKLNFCSQTNFYPIGWPRLDRWYEGMNVNLHEILELLNCDRYRPVLVWMPTWGELSSIDLYAETLASLNSRYNIVVKPHDYTLLEEPERIKLLKDMHFQAVITEPFDDLLLYVAADYVLADYGGTPFGSIFTDQRLILLDVPEAFNHPFTGFGSSDVILRNYYPSLDVASHTEDFVRLIEGPDLWKRGARHNRMRDRVFAPMYGRASEEAAMILAAAAQLAV